MSKVFFDVGTSLDGYIPAGMDGGAQNPLGDGGSNIHNWMFKQRSFRKHLVPSLLPPLTTSSKILCTDCHNNDSVSGPRGPHGSMNPYLLAKNYTTADNTTESPWTYELCYSCHSRSSILADQSFKQHNSHTVTYRAPCSACHDAHGISITQGNPVNNAALISFDLGIVQPNSMGQLYFQKNGTYSGSCSLSCHVANHVLKPY